MRQHMKNKHLRGRFICVGKPRLCCPEGTSENSPAFQRWVGRQEVASPEGTAEFQSHRPSFSRPFGTCVPCGLFPGVKTPGYSRYVPPGQKNLAVACSSKQSARFVSHAFKCISRPRCPARRMYDTSIQGSGRILRALSACRGAALSEALFEESENSVGCSLREKVRVRGKVALAWQWPEESPTPRKLLIAYHV